MEILLAFVLLSASINAIMVALKRMPKVGESKFFKNWASLIPLAIGALAGPFMAIYMDQFWMYGLAAGILAGSLATSSYDLVKAVLKRKAEEI